VITVTLADACEMREVEERNVFCGAYNVLVLDHE